MHVWNVLHAALWKYRMQEIAKNRNLGTIARVCRVWGTPANFHQFRLWLRFCSNVAQRRSTKLCRMFGRLLGWYTICTFLAALAPDGILPAAKFTLCPSLALYYIGSVSPRHSSSGRQPNFVGWYKKWNYVTFAEGATYIRLGDHHVGHWPTF